MNNAEIDDSVLVINTVENFQAVYALLYPHLDPTPHLDNVPYIRINLSTDAAFYSTGERKQPLISLDLLM